MKDANILRLAQVTIIVDSTGRKTKEHSKRSLWVYDLEKIRHHFHLKILTKAKINETNKEVAGKMSKKHNDLKIACFMTSQTKGRGSLMSTIKKGKKKHWKTG